MNKIDLHIHSYFSDGENSFLELLQLAKEMKLEMFSITDHNFISEEQKQFKMLANQSNINFIEGIEVSCVDRVTGKSLHILGYSRNFNVKKINSYLLGTVNGYNDRAGKIIDKLNNKFGANFDLEKIKTEEKCVYVSRNHLIKRLSFFLGDKKLSKEELLREVFIDEDDSWMLDSAKAIKIINECGGVAVLAHPKEMVLKQDFDKLMGRLVDCGLRGIETYYPKHSDIIIQSLMNISKKYNLIQTAGSDWHGKSFSNIAIGMEVPETVYNSIISTI